MAKKTIISNKPAPSGQVPEMFNHIAPVYDPINRVLSLGLDLTWRKKLRKALEPFKPKQILDIACGTGDILKVLQQLGPKRLWGLDPSREMLRVARKKTWNNAGVEPEFIEGFAEELPFGDQEMDAVTVAFGVRNYADLHQGLTQAFRVLRPGGVHAVLEFSHPRNYFFRQAFFVYLRFILPMIGFALSGNYKAYSYLGRTIQQFPSGAAFLDRMRAAGFKECRSMALSGGICTLYLGIK